MPHHACAVPTRWSDVDWLGHVNNVVLLRYLQEARVDMLFRDAASRGTTGLASGVLIHRHDVSYDAPIQITTSGDGRPLPVRIDLHVTRVTAASFEIGYDVRDSAGVVCARASSILVPYDLDGEHLRRLTADERAVLHGFADDRGPAGQPDGGAVSGPAASRHGGDGHGPARWPGATAAFTTECSVRFDDLDSYGHVNNVTIAEYLQQARIELGRGLLDEHRDTHERQVVARLVIDYVRPISFRTEPVSVDVVVTRIGTSSFDLAYEIRDAATVFARAASSMVSYDVHAARSRPLSDGERAALEQLQAPVWSAA